MHWSLFMALFSWTKMFCIICSLVIIKLVNSGEACKVVNGAASTFPASKPLSDKVLVNIYAAIFLAEFVCIICSLVIIKLVDRGEACKVVIGATSAFPASKPAS
jgi:hypothetical protein